MKKLISCFVEPTNMSSSDEEDLNLKKKRSAATPMRWYLIQIAETDIYTIIWSEEYDHLKLKERFAEKIDTHLGKVDECFIVKMSPNILMSRTTYSDRARRKIILDQEFMQFLKLGKNLLEIQMPKNYVQK